MKMIELPTQQCLFDPFEGGKRTRTSKELLSLRAPSYALAP
jgi:hypothetical protein